MTMKFVNLNRKGSETYIDAVVNNGCGPNFVKNRWKLFRQMIKEQGVKFWFRFWLTFSLEPDIKEQDEFSRHLPIVTTSLRQYIHTHFVQVSSRDAINFCWHNVFDDDPSPVGIIEIVVSDTQFIDETYLYVQTSFACALGEVFFKWLHAEDASRTEDKYWTVPSIYLDADFQPGPLERFMVKQWGRNLPSLFGVKIEQVPWIRKCLRYKGNYYSTEEEENFLHPKPECLKTKTVSRHLKTWGMKVKKMKKIIEEVDEKRLLTSDDKPRICHVFKVIKKPEVNKTKARHLMNKHIFFKQLQDGATNSASNVKLQTLMIRDEKGKRSQQFTHNAIKALQKSMSVDGSICLDKIPLNDCKFPAERDVTVYRNSAQRTISDSSVIKFESADSITDTVTVVTNSTDDRGRLYKYKSKNEIKDRKTCSSSSTSTSVKNDNGDDFKIKNSRASSGVRFKIPKYSKIDPGSEFLTQKCISTDDSTFSTSNSNRTAAKLLKYNGRAQKYTSTDESTVFTPSSCRSKAQKYASVTGTKSKLQKFSHEKVQVYTNTDENSNSKVPKCTITDDNTTSKLQKCTITDDNIKSKSQKCTNTEENNQKSLKYPSTSYHYHRHSKSHERQSKVSQRTTSDSIPPSRSTSTGRSAHKSTSTISIIPETKSTNTVDLVHTSTSTIFTDTVDRSTTTCAIGMTIDGWTNTDVNAEQIAKFPIQFQEVTPEDPMYLVNFPGREYNCTIQSCKRNDCPIRIQNVFLETSTNTEKADRTTDPITITASDNSTNTEIHVTKHKATDTFFDACNMESSNNAAAKEVVIPTDFIARLNSVAKDVYNPVEAWGNHVKTETPTTSVETSLLNRPTTSTVTAEVETSNHGSNSSAGSLDMLLNPPPPLVFSRDNEKTTTTSGSTLDSGSKKKTKPKAKLRDGKAKPNLPVKISNGRRSFPEKSNTTTSSTGKPKNFSSSLSREILRQTKVDFSLPPKPPKPVENKTVTVSTSTGLSPVDKYKATSSTLTTLERANNIVTDFRPIDKPIKLNARFSPVTNTITNTTSNTGNPENNTSDCSFIDISSEISPDDLRAIEKLQSIITKLNDINKSDLLSNDGFPSSAVTDLVWPTSDDEGSKKCPLRMSSPKLMKPTFEVQKLTKSSDLPSRIPKSITKLPNVVTKPSYSMCKMQRSHNRDEKLEKLAAKNVKCDVNCKECYESFEARKPAGGGGNEELKIVNEEGVKRKMGKSQVLLWYRKSN